MIISLSYAKRLIRSGRAVATTHVAPDDRGRVYVALTRYDVQRTDHARDDDRSVAIAEL